MEYLTSGAQADIYKDGSNAIKLFKNFVQKSDVEYEVNLQKMAFEYGLPVPKIFDIVEIDGKFGIVMEYVDGVPVGKIIFEDSSKFEYYMAKSIEIQNNIHKIETNKFPSMKSILIKQISGANKLSQNEKEKLLLKLDNTLFDNKLCHGDFHILNLLQTSNGIKIIDWVNSNSGSPDADIYRTYLLYKLYKEEIANNYLDIYCKIMKVDKAKILSWAFIIAGARLGEYVKDEKEEQILREILTNNV